MQTYSLNPSPSAIYIVGAGGVASQLIHTLTKLLIAVGEGYIPIIIIDGDTLEPRNLDRQLFNLDQVGLNKAEALAQLVHYDQIKVIPEWFADGLPVVEGALFLSCVDNHTARREILSTVDRTQGFTIMGGNELTDAEAFYYQADWRGGPLDPRVYYPAIRTDTADDPRRRGIGCTGEVLRTTPQLALANMGAAYYMLHLFWFHFVVNQHLDPDVEPHTPIRHHNNFSRCGTIRREQLKEQHANQNQKTTQEERTSPGGNPASTTSTTPQTEEAAPAHQPLPA